MTVYFVSRHEGSAEWVNGRGIHIDKQLEHFDPAWVEPGDTVVGSLPVHLAARVCEAGGRYLHLSLDIPREARGKALTAEDMTACGARLERFVVARRGTEI